MGCRIWAMKFCILAVYARIVDKQPKYQLFIWYIWASLFLTWVASVVVTLFECRPFNQWVNPCLRHLPLFDAWNFSDMSTVIVSLRIDSRDC